MRLTLHLLVFLIFLLSPGLLAAAESSAKIAAEVDLEFSGYKFGQSPSANMVCQSGYCKSRTPDGDGLFTFPYSTYVTPDAVSTLAGLTVVNPRYTFWDDRLYRIFFQVDCTLLDSRECLDDILTTLDREYTLIPLTSNESQQFVLKRQLIVKQFLTESGAFINVRLTTLDKVPQMPMVEIIDKGTANLVGSTLSPTYKPKYLALPESFKQP